MSDDSTNHVDSPAMPPTQPTLETILERINALGESLRAEISEVRQGQEELRTEAVEIKTQLKEVDSKLTELRDGQEKIKSELWAIRTGFARSYGDLLIGQEMHERRISDLEKKVS